MLTVLTGPVIIHSVWWHKPRFAELVTVMRQDGPFLTELGANGSLTTASLARTIHGGDRLAWVLRTCLSREAVLDVETELTGGDAFGSPVSWGRESVAFQPGECRNVVLQASVPVGAGPDRYELRAELRMILKSGRVLVHQLAPLDVVVVGGPPK